MLTDQLAALAFRLVVAYGRHAARPWVLGPAEEAERLRCAYYEARCAVADQNPVFAASLLPLSPTTPAFGPGLPLLPTGVRYVVNPPPANTITLTLDVAFAPGITVLPPGLNAQPFSPPVVLGGTRLTTTFPAVADGLHTIIVALGSTRVATLYVPVQRAEWQRLREQSRRLRYQFRASLPRPDAAYRERLALLTAGDAAARVGDVALFSQLAQAAAQVPQSPTPVALYPR